MHVIILETIIDISCLLVLYTFSLVATSHQISPQAAVQRALFIAGCVAIKMLGLYVTAFTLRVNDGTSIKGVSLPLL